ncbi:MAG: TorD/DmsD family molecular chaperone [Thermodesulfobacteriota bacterium]
MTDEQRVLFCEVISSCLLTPTIEIAENISGGDFYLFFKDYLNFTDINYDTIKGFLSVGNPNTILKILEEEYYRLFSDFGDKKISLVESYYKPWTIDPYCLLSFAQEKGFLMGDSAIHMLTLFNYYGLEIDRSFQGMPDHIVIELEFLSYLYKNKDEAALKSFIRDHLDWISLVTAKVKNSNPHPFYLSSLEILNIFLDKERKRLEVCPDE